MRLTYIKLIVLFLMIFGVPISLNAQSLEEQTLLEMGMEDIRVKIEGNESYISFEDNIYRGNYRGIYEVISALREVVPTQILNLVVLSDGVAQISLVVPEDINNIQVSYSTYEVTNKLSDVKAVNRRFGKAELVIYPELFLENSWLDKFYGYAVNISPAVEVSLWRGAEFTGQVVFPIATNMIDEHQYIRAGFLTIRQSFRLPKNIMGNVTVGNFDCSRMGVDANLWYNVPSGSFSFGLNGGLTGSSTFYQGKWELSMWKRLSGLAWVSYYEPHYAMEMKLSGGRMLYGDWGVRADMTRHFGEVAVSFYAQYCGGDPNGGFAFSVPLPAKSRWHRSPVRVTIPEEFNRVYKASSSRDLLRGYQYLTRPDEGLNTNFYNPKYIRDRVLKLYDN